VPFSLPAKLLAYVSRSRGHLGSIVAAGLLFLLTLAALACKSDYPASARQNPAGGEKGAPRQVKTARVAEMPMGRSVNVTGTLAAYDQATLSAKVPGRLRVVSVDLGSVVKRGQVIAQIEPQDYQLRVQQAEAALAQARARLGLSPEGTDDRVDAELTGTVRSARATLNEAQANRNRAAKLVSEGVIARAEFESADAALKVALARYQDAVEEVRNRQALLSQRRSELALARQQLADTSIYASFDGMVQEKRASVGEYLAAGAPIVNIVKMNPLRLRAEVPEREAQSVRMGQQTRVKVEGGAYDYAGRIMRLSPTISEQNRVLVVEAEISNDGSLRPGAFVSAEIVTDDSGMAVTVPTSAIVTFAGIEKVILVQNGKALEKPVATGRRAADWTEILGGVNVGDLVVVEPGNLQSGQAVNVVE
jgi:RND family efflux transporter MFP subunit